MAADFLDARTLLGLRLAVDTAALVLIWLVQLVIYPAFLYYAEADFRGWHPVYTQRVTYVVLPVMLVQLALYAYLALTAGTWDVWANSLLVVAVWGLTFFLAVPLHAGLDGTEPHLPLVERLLVVNWWRTGLWTLTWLVSLLVLLKGE